MIDGIIVIGIVCLGFIAMWTIGALVLKACFKIADVIFK